MGYKQLDFQKSCQIYGFWRAGYNQVQIAKELGVHKSTISREFKSNMTFVCTALGSWQYKTHYAQRLRPIAKLDMPPTNRRGKVWHIE